MATRVGEAYLAITANNAQLKSKMRESEKEGKKFTQRLGASLKRFGKVAFVGAIAGFTALTAVMIKAANAAAIEQVQTEQLRHQLRRLGLDTKLAMQDVDELANAQQRYTRFGDTQTRAMLAQMIMLTDDYEGSMRNLSLAQDMAESGMFDQRSAARYLGMAMQGNIEMLGRYIPELKTSVNESLKQMSASEKAAYAVELLDAKFGGLARTIGDTAAGAWAKLKNAISDAWEALGVGALDEITTGFVSLSDEIKRNEGRIERWGRTIVKVFKWIAEKVEPYFAAIEAAQEGAIRPVEPRPRRISMRELGVFGAGMQPLGTAAQQRYEEGLKSIAHQSGVIISKVRELASERKISIKEEELWLDAITNVYQEFYNQAIGYEEALKRLTALDKERGRTITEMLEKTKELTRIEKEAAVAGEFRRELGYRMAAAEKELELKRKLNKAEAELIKILERQKAQREAIRLVKKLDVREEIRPAPKFPALTKEQIDKIFPVAEAPRQTTAPRWMSAEQVWKEAVLAGVKNPQLEEAKKQTKATEEMSEILEDIDGNLVRLLTLE